MTMQSSHSRRPLSRWPTRAAVPRLCRSQGPLRQPLCAAVFPINFDWASIIIRSELLDSWPNLQASVQETLRVAEALAAQAHSLVATAPDTPSVDATTTTGAHGNTAHGPDGSHHEGESLPAGWTTATSRSTDETYYVHTESGESTYERPTGDAEAEGPETVPLVPLETSSARNAMSVTETQRIHDAHVEALETQIAEAGGLCDRMAAEAEGLHDKVAALRAEVAALRAENETLKSER